MSLEDVLKQLEQADTSTTHPERNPEKYYFSVFGEPSDTGTWDSGLRAITSARISPS